MQWMLYSLLLFFVRLLVYIIYKNMKKINPNKTWSKSIQSKLTRLFFYRYGLILTICFWVLCFNRHYSYLEGERYTIIMQSLSGRTLVQAEVTYGTRIMGIFYMSILNFSICKYWTRNFYFLSYMIPNTATADIMKVCVTVFLIN